MKIELTEVGHWRGDPVLRCHGQRWIYFYQGEFHLPTDPNAFTCGLDFLTYPTLLNLVGWEVGDYVEEATELPIDSWVIHKGHPTQIRFIHNVGGCTQIFPLG